jgi:hypothetical protein
VLDQRSALGLVDVGSPVGRADVSATPPDGVDEPLRTTTISPFSNGVITGSQTPENLVNVPPAGSLSV